MLNTPATYPNPGSWALFGYDGETRAVRILGTSGKAGLVPIAIADKPFTASGNLSAAADKLLDPTPLDPAERAEMAELDARISRRRRPARADVKRFNALQERQARALTLAGLLRRLEDRRLATPASRAALQVWEAALGASSPGALRSAPPAGQGARA
jgi:hypothetical protein